MQHNPLDPTLEKRESDMRTITADGRVGTPPEPKHGKKYDYVKFRLGTKEYGDDETMWFNVLCYDRVARIVMENLKVGNHIMIIGILLQQRRATDDPTIKLLDFKWLNSPKEEKEEPEDEEFNFGDWDSYQEIPFNE